MNIKLNLSELDSIELKFPNKIPIYSNDKKYLFDGILLENSVEIDEKSIRINSEEQNKLKILIEKNLVYCSIFGIPTFEFHKIVKINVQGLNLIFDESCQLK